ncbi:Proliferation Marker Protein Ki-67 [Manis pentadactyla]|nr:Proliferation Marker Protein Ki-67 [Manis pentadactyla]
MGPPAHLVTIRRSGVDGHHFPLSLSTCLFGRGIECDIRIQLPVVSKQHCKIEIHGLEAILFNLSSTNPTQVNGSAIDEPVQLKHGDVITVVDRSFRYENESHQNGSKSSEFPGQRHEQEPRRGDSRSSFSSDPEGKVQDSNAHSKLTEANISGRPLVHAKNVRAAGTDSGGPEDLAAGKTLNAVHSSELPGGNHRHRMDPTAGDFEEDSSVALVSCDGALKSFPCTQCLENSEKNKSPFRKLYESLKEELDVKLEKENVQQNRRRSGSKSRRTAEQENAGGLQGETQLLVSLKSRRRSSRSIQVKADPASGEGSSRAEADGREEKPSQRPRLIGSPGTSLVKTPKPNSPVQHSQQNSSRKRRREDLSAISGRASVSPDQSGGSRADNKIFTPTKFLTRNQTPTKTENTDNFGNTPEKLFSKRKRSISTNVDVLTTEMDIQSQTILAPLVVQVEKKIEDDSAAQPEKPGPPAGRVCAASPGLGSADVSNFGDASSKIEGMALKRRRVSFGGHLRPELFDENLPPNTPLKRGETPKKRKSLVTLTPPVLKKIIKEQPQPSGKEGSSESPVEVTAQNAFMSSPAGDPVETPAARGQRRRSCMAPSISTSNSPHPTEAPKRGRRRSSNLPSKRTSIDRSQRNILQMVYSRRRSGASEANLIVAKSWADVVKLGAKQSQPKVGKQGPQRQLNKRQRRVSTPKRPTGSVHNQFSTGHANSPCTIVIGKAHIEKVHMPARPYRMLNNFVFNKKMDFNEDLSGLTNMFKTPAKEEPQMSVCPTTSSDSENSLGKTFQVPDVGEKPLLCTSENLGENMFLRTQNAPKELSDTSSTSPPLRRPSIRVNADSVKTPRNVCKTPGVEMRTPRLEAASPKMASSANKFRRSAQLPNAQVPRVECKNRKEETEPDIVARVSGRCLRETPLQEQKPEGEMKERGKPSGTCKVDIESKENTEKMMTVRRSRSSEWKCEPTADLTALQPSRDTNPKEDQVDVQSPLHTPGLSKEPGNGESTTKLHCKSPKPEPISTPARTNTPPKTPLGRVGAQEGVSALRMPTKTRGGATASHGEPGGDDKGITLLNGTPKQKQDPTGNITGPKRRPRTPKAKARLLEDLAGLSELFRSPDHAKDPVTDEHTTNILCPSPQPELVTTCPGLSRRLRTPPCKVDVEELSALRNPTQTPGGTTSSPRKPGGGDRATAVSEEAPEPKLDPAEYVTGSKKRPRTPKGKAQLLEDLAGLSELFRTPEHAKGPVTDEHTTKMPCKSLQAELVTMPTSKKKGPRTPLGRVGAREGPSALRTPTQTPGGATASHGEPGGDDKGVTLLKGTPKQKQDPTGNVTGPKKRPRTPKGKAQLLEDLAGLSERFRSPDHTVGPVTDVQTTKMPCTSPQPEPAIIPTSMKGWLRTPVQIVDGKDDLLTLRTPTQTPGETTQLHRETGGGDEAIKVLKGAPKQNLDPAENVTGTKRHPRTPKGKAQFLEDLAGLSELFRTPDHTVGPVTDDQTMKMPCKSLQAELVTTPTSKKKGPQTPLGRVGAREGPSALRTPTQTPGRATASHGEPGGDDKGITLLNGTPKQKQDPTGNITGPKRRPRTPKAKARLLEDLAGLSELFRSPDHAKDPVTDEHTTNILCPSPQPELVTTCPGLSRRLRTPPCKVDVEELSALRNPTQTPGGTTSSPRKPGGGDRATAVSEEAPEPKLDPAEYVTGSKRRPRTPKGKAQLLEDLAGLSELFRTPEHAKGPVTDEHTTKMPCKSLQAELVTTPTSKKKGPRTPLGRVGAREGPSALSTPTQTPGGATASHGEPGGDDKGVTLLKGTPKQKQDPTGNVTGPKRRPRTPKGKAQLLEDLAGLSERFRSPDHTVGPVTDVQTTKMPCTSPQPEPAIIPTSMKGWLRTPVQIVDGKDDLLTLRTPTQTPGETTQLHRETGGGDEAIKVLKGAPKQNLDPAENVTGTKRHPRTPKGKAQLLEDPAGLSELFRSPEHAKGPVTDEHTSAILCPSPQAEPVTTRTSRKRRLRAPADLGEELSALRKPTRRQPGGDGKGIPLFWETARQKLGSEENVTRTKRRPRACKEKAQPLEDLAGCKGHFRTSDHAEGPTANDQTTEEPCKPQAEPVPMRTSKRQLKVPPQKAGAWAELPALRTPTQTPKGPMASHRELQGGDKGATLLKEPAEPKQDRAGNVTGTNRRPRTCKEKVQAPEDLPGCKERIQSPEHAKEPGNEAASIEPSPKQTPDRRKPVKMSGRALRALKVKPTEDPVKPHSESSISLPPKRKRGEDGSATGTKRLPTLTAPQESGDEKPLQKRRRECRRPPEAPVIKRSLRILEKRIKPVEDLPSSHMKMRKPGRTEEDVTSPDQVTGMSLRSRRPNNTNVEEQRPELHIPEEKIKVKRNEKTSMKTSQEVKLQNPDEGAKNPSSKETHGGRRGLRSQTLKVSLPNTAGEESVGIHGGNQKEKEGKEPAGFRSLRSRKRTAPPPGTAVESSSEASERRVTRGAKRCAENIKKDNDNAGIKKMRTRSCRNTEDT